MSDTARRSQSFADQLEEIIHEARLQPNEVGCNEYVQKALAALDRAIADSAPETPDLSKFLDEESVRIGYKKGRWETLTAFRQAVGLSKVTKKEG